MKQNIENPAEVKFMHDQSKKPFRYFRRKCEQFCNEWDDCEIYAVNNLAKPQPRCHMFTKEHLEKNLINWNKSNGNNDWVSRKSKIYPV